MDRTSFHTVLVLHILSQRPKLIHTFHVSAIDMILKSGNSVLSSLSTNTPIKLTKMDRTISSIVAQLLQISRTPLLDSIMELLRAYFEMTRTVDVLTADPWRRYVLSYLFTLAVTCPVVLQAFFSDVLQRVRQENIADICIFEAFSGLSEYSRQQGEKDPTANVAASWLTYLVQTVESLGPEDLVDLFLLAELVYSGRVSQMQAKFQKSRLPDAIGAVQKQANDLMWIVVNKIQITVLTKPLSTSTPTDPSSAMDARAVALAKVLRDYASHKTLDKSDAVFTLLCSCLARASDPATVFSTLLLNPATLTPDGQAGLVELVKDLNSTLQGKMPRLLGTTLLNLLDAVQVESEATRNGFFKSLPALLPCVGKSERKAIVNELFDSLQASQHSGSSAASPGDLSLLSCCGDIILDDMTSNKPNTLAALSFLESSLTWADWPGSGEHASFDNQAIQAIFAMLPSAIVVPVSRLLDSGTAGTVQKKVGESADNELTNTPAFRKPSVVSLLDQINESGKISTNARRGELRPAAAPQKSEPLQAIPIIIPTQKLQTARQPWLNHLPDWMEIAFNAENGILEKRNVARMLMRRFVRVPPARVVDIFIEKPTLWDILENLVSDYTSLILVVDIIRAIHSAALGFWRQTKTRASTRPAGEAFRKEVDIAIRVTRALAKARILPPPLSDSSLILHLIPATDVATLLGLFWDFVELNVERITKQGPVAVAEPGQSQQQQQQPLGKDELAKWEQSVATLNAVLKKNVKTTAKFFAVFYAP
ncbi:uncharacterized protein EV422DRAFT_189890 [Fimicolochytrium jonesii]|uniref:uncharacterized protein n=1 Tax=Fimicolochytrium jonesii TaxID=1396493 RepID=UPI0022FE93EA|nr:uncharacterized protein EV422DRAFT_189890 [Fimicolochytrium jonesii]KAI8818106.1 hypothetical protein EV422DRAFT_189890 [Fimicolochytrium jonesii]